MFFTYQVLSQHISLFSAVTNLHHFPSSFPPSSPSHLLSLTPLLQTHPLKFIAFYFDYYWYLHMYMMYTHAHTHNLMSSLFLCVYRCFQGCPFCTEQPIRVSLFPGWGYFSFPLHALVCCGRCSGVGLYINFPFHVNMSMDISGFSPILLIQLFIAERVSQQNSWCSGF